MMRQASLALLAVGLVAPQAWADPTELGAAKESFNAGAIAYAAGDYLAAIQALEAAYRMTPLPAIAFSLAQAERRQYFVSHEPAHLVRACELYRRYLVEVPVGGRRADATDGLAQLEPLAASLGASVTATSPASTPEAAKTRLMVSSSAPNAAVSLDGAAAVPAPLITEVPPGPHQVRVEASGFASKERPVVAVPGALVPLDVPLEELPSKVLLHAPASADFYVDGRLQGKVGAHHDFALPSGRHSFTFALNGHEVAILDADLGRGETRRLEPSFKATGQRTASFVLFGVGGAALVTGFTFGGLAFAQQNKADRILDDRQTGNISASDLDEYEQSVRRRDQFRTVAAVGLTTSAISLLTAIVLYELDAPSVHEELPPGDRRASKAAPAVAFVAPSAGEGVAVRVGF
jgi:hypothetical protein